MKRLKFTLILFLTISLNGFSQTPTDFLSKEFHKERRDLLRSKMPANSVTVVFANPLRNRANDVDYVFHQDPNFYYLTGYREPNGVLVLFSDDQTDADGNTYNEILYVQKRDKRAEQWNGKRLGVEGAKNELGFKMAFNASEFIESNIDFKKFDKVFIEKFNDDYRNLSGADVFDLVKSFKQKSGYDPNIFLSQIKKYVYSNVAETPIESSANVISIIDRMADRSSEIKNDELLNKYKSAESDKLKNEIKQKISLALKPKTNIDLSFLSANLATMREVKTAAELKLLTKAVRISAVGQIEVMKAMKPHMSETELQGIHEFVYKKYGAEYEGYPSIVGAGNNGCILHYIENNKTKVANDLVLMDLGAEYRGFTADVTRTIPANGKFTKAQKEIYDLVYEAQEAGIALYTIGEKMSAPNQAARKIINQGLFELGIIKSVDERHNYFPHGTSHHIGLDVHDPGNYNTFEENMVVTMEPGIYIPEGSACDKKYWGIGIRIEDDILVTKKGPVNLSAEAPRTTEEIEKMMAKKSVLDEFVLPNLDK
ncbi:peptidase M24 family protein [Polaribacter reichenbachii]|uniref:Xaa-Pro aminopeptidase n=1 Tax=Polaribacter reichenbachii TaxID=996801 RepID=A0A1B8TZV2_9FLAO|nr:aminopeptidase P N-terminal domain-containing protein [Polaribacter reichenbachii]APZ47190.1 peptidase M24 family protein [Polaribacter reichenbachii]AUC17830.1 peptidase M24 family protein [Polaribacter reichenbachii]OBY65145.1 xaa-pro aminopeptidase [Polaribacter reichenbachii]